MTYERQLDLTVERLAQLPAARLAAAEDLVYAVLDAMTDRPVPRLRPVGWADQLLVIGRGVSQRSRGELEQRLLELRRSFDLTL